MTTATSRTLATGHAGLNVGDLGLSSPNGFSVQARTKRRPAAMFVGRSSALASGALSRNSGYRWSRVFVVMTAAPT